MPLTDFVVADRKDAQKVCNSACPSRDFNGMDAKGIDPVKLGTLYAVLTDTEYDASFASGTSAWRRAKRSSLPSTASLRESLWALPRKTTGSTTGWSTIRVSASASRVRGRACRQARESGLRISTLELQVVVGPRVTVDGAGIR